MSQTTNLVVANNIGCGMSEGRCLPCSGVSGRTAAVYTCSSLSHCRIHSHVKIRGLKCVSVGASFVCKARRNPDFSRQHKHGSSRNTNRHNEGRDSFENFEDDMLSLKNGPLVSLSASGKSQATAVPGPREKEIVELFRKVQAKLRERAATKEQKKVEASPGKGKESGTVDSLLKLLKKHSNEQQKKSSGGGRGKDSSLDGSQESSQYNGRRITQFSDLDNAPKESSGGGRGKDSSLDGSQESSQYNGRRSTKFSDLDNAPKGESQESNISSVTRPRSSFQRRSPVPRVKLQPVSYDDENRNVVPPSSEVRGNDHDQRDLKLNHKEGPGSEPDIDHDLEPDSLPDLDQESDHDSEPVLLPKDDLFFPDREIDDLSDDDSEHIDNEEHAVEEELVVQHEDLSALKLPELRSLAKSRGLKGFSKMKKDNLVELLTRS
ncbi:PREDICTED: rho-N domain-containing protein 1, chloroplastic-like isoform X3 [Lupinus angustifolius]|uniref:rho-N domain-containing protein 1, chloroplastic-like isoform X3 n=1 Tax=Lupinus angustifolius TaxID=3871 RepID=UPI00092EF7E8|nr:PREDICTED: rho-N domain-containing protein 1, chloroplastic-like isoform X3 [Lupinus angustifolius]